ncbi:unnamed protein product [Lactuca virosa]|uniref:non-specific serine/threonine protein kinase n=1 Tax=Lactuca virosa TaxID=75947 RepID=A0AAU9LQJ0_9ASTR|nr:unnamed protein product [Lactuca virosa]
MRVAAGGVRSEERAMGETRRGSDDRWGFGGVGSTEEEEVGVGSFRSMLLTSNLHRRQHSDQNSISDSLLVGLFASRQQFVPSLEVTFLTEIELLSRLHHCHVVPLLGYCLEYQYHTKQPEMLLVFEYMPNGNLRECLDGVSEKCLDWGARIAVAIGAARGLEYLREAAAPRILHRDVKSTNILLDENWRAKITDLGMAKSLVK